MDKFSDQGSNPAQNWGSANPLHVDGLPSKILLKTVLIMGLLNMLVSRLKASAQKRAEFAVHKVSVTVTLFIGAGNEES